MTLNLKDKTDEELAALIAATEEALDDALGKVAREGDVKEGFQAFFRLLYGDKVLDHQLKALDKIIADHDDGKKGTVIEEFRGAAKTTTFTVAWATYMLSRDPTKSWLLIQAGKEIAADNSQKVADHIANNPGYKKAFPYIVPDEKLGWGASGYEVKKTHESYEDWEVGNKLSYTAWRQKNAGRIGPSFVAKGYKEAIIGKRPDGLIIDDINDEKNTISERELRTVKKILTGTIFPAANRAKWIIVIGTPWNENDVIHYCLTTGQFGHMKIPVYEEVDDVKVYAWPEEFGEKQVKIEKDMAGDIEFARMFLLDLTKTKGLVLKKEWLQTWPEYRPDWQTVIGIDYTSTEDPRKQRGDYFALTVGKIIPGGKGVVLIDGAREKVSHAEAQMLAIAWCGKYQNLYGLGVEAILQGQMFYNDLLNNAELRSMGVIPLPVRFNKSKGYRFEKIMAPLFQRGRIYILEEEKTHLRLFEEEWMNWQGDALEDVHPNDILDSVYALTQAAAGFVTPIARVRDTGNPMYRDKDSKGVFRAFGRS